MRRVSKGCQAGPSGTPEVNYDEKKATIEPLKQHGGVGGPCSGTNSRSLSDQGGIMKYIIKENVTPDENYTRLVAEAGLYCIAFFGHKGTKSQKAKLAYIWQKANGGGK